MMNSLDRYLLVSLCLFSVASFLSIAGSNVFLGLSTLLFLIVLSKNKDKGIYCEGKEYFKVISVFAGSLLISALLSGNIGFGLKTWSDYFVWRFMPFMIVLMFLNTKEKVSKLLGTVACGYLISCLYAIYQGVFVYKLNIASGRAASFVGHPMTLAGWSCILLPVLLICIFKKDISKKLQMVLGILFVVGCTALVFNSTRGAWLALVITLPLISLPFILKSKKAFFTFVSVVVLLGTVLVSSPSFMKRVDSITDTKTNWSNASRFIIWDTAYSIFKEHPVLGIGLGQFKYEYKNTVVDRTVKSGVHLKEWQKKQLKALSHAHNNFFQMLAENGLVGFAGYIFAFGFILWKNIKNYFMNKNPYALMIVGSTGALMLQGLTEYNFGNGAVMKLYWLVLGCLIVLAGKYNENIKNSNNY